VRRYEVPEAVETRRAEVSPTWAIVRERREEE
jgi:hypothetical protein